METNRSRPRWELQRLSPRSKLEHSLSSISSASDAEQEVAVVRDEDEFRAD